MNTTSCVSPGSISICDLDRGTRVEARPGPAGQVLPLECRGVRGRAVATEEFGAIAGDRAGPVQDVGEGDPVAELEPVRIAREQCAARRIDFGDYKLAGLFASPAEDPLGVISGRNSSRPVGPIGELQRYKLDGVVDRDENRQRLTELGKFAFVDRIALPVPNINGPRPERIRRRRPDVAADFVADVNGLSGRVGHRVVRPRRQAVRLAVDAQLQPSDDSVTKQPKLAFASTLAHGAGGKPGPTRMTYSRPSSVKPPIPLSNNRAQSRRQPAAAVGRSGRRWPVPGSHSAGKSGDASCRSSCSSQTSIGGVQDDPGSRSQQDPFVLGHRVGGYKQVPNSEYRSGHRLGYLSDEEYVAAARHVLSLRKSEEFLKTAKPPRDTWNWDRSLR